MILLSVVFLSLLQGSFSKTVQTVLQHYKLELRYVCSDTYAKETQATSEIDCAVKMIATNHHGFHNISGACYLHAKSATEQSICWTVVE